MTDRAIEKNASYWALLHRRRTLDAAEVKEFEFWKSAKSENDDEFAAAMATLAKVDRAVQIRDLGALDRYAHAASERRRRLWILAAIAIACSALLLMWDKIPK